MNKNRITNPNNKKVLDCKSRTKTINQTAKALKPTDYFIDIHGATPVFGNIQLLFPSNAKGFFDDPRDTHMIKKGYSR